MWGFLLEWLDGFITLPWRVRADQSVSRSLLGLGFLGCVMMGLALRRPLFATIPLSYALFAITNVGLAYRALERAAVLDLDDPAQPPRHPHRLVPFAIPTALALFGLAQALDAVRRGKTSEADALVRTIDPSKLRGSEARLLQGARALVTLSHGNRPRAAEQALAALPTGCEDLDVHLGRLALASAWGNPVRLQKIDEAWRDAGVGASGDGGLSLLRRLVGLALDEAEPRGEGLSQDELSALAAEARAVGDEGLARELDASRASTRGYR